MKGRWCSNPWSGAPGFGSLAEKEPVCSDYVVIESTTNAWHVYDLLVRLVERVLVANPIKVKQIACARVKTDIRDTLKTNNRVRVCQAVSRLKQQTKNGSEQ